MNISLHDLRRINALVGWLLSNTDLPKDNIEFYTTVFNALQPYIAMGPTMKFLPSSRVVIPFHIMIDVNSIIIEHGQKYLYHSFMNERNRAESFQWFDPDIN